MLWAQWCFVVEAGEESDDIPWHGYVDVSFFIVPLEGDATVEFALPVYFQLVVLFEHGNQVMGILLSDVLHAKVVDSECELCWASCVLPESRLVGYLVVSVWSEALA